MADFYVYTAMYVCSGGAMHGTSSGGPHPPPTQFIETVSAFPDALFTFPLPAVFGCRPVVVSGEVESDGDETEAASFTGRAAIPGHGGTPVAVVVSPQVVIARFVSLVDGALFSGPPLWCLAS
ncbi:hypothetical protein ACFQX6_31370 [Streptosporangium lutulentum]